MQWGWLAWWCADHWTVCGLCLMARRLVYRALGLNPVLTIGTLREIAARRLQASPYFEPQTNREAPMLDGYKTYIAVAAILLCVVVEAGLGIDIPGFDAKQDWLGWVLAALGLGGLRSAVAKV